MHPRETPRATTGRTLGAAPWAPQRVRQGPAGLGPPALALAGGVLSASDGGVERAEVRPLARVAVVEAAPHVGEQRPGGDAELEAAGAGVVDARRARRSSCRSAPPTSWATISAAIQRRTRASGSTRPAARRAATTGSRWSGLNGKRRNSSSVSTIMITAKRTTTDERPATEPVAHDAAQPVSSTTPASTPMTAAFLVSARPRCTPRPAKLELVVEEVGGPVGRQPRRHEAQARRARARRPPCGPCPRTAAGRPRRRCRCATSQASTSSTARRAAADRQARTARPPATGRPRRDATAPASTRPSAHVKSPRLVAAIQNHGLLASTSIASTGQRAAFAPAAAPGRTTGTAARTRRWPG